jgi:hypothetical protein
MGAGDRTAVARGGAFCGEIRAIQKARPEDEVRTHV